MPLVTFNLVLHYFKGGSGGGRELGVVAPYNQSGAPQYEKMRSPACVLKKLSKTTIIQTCWRPPFSNSHHPPLLELGAGSTPWLLTCSFVQGPQWKSVCRLIAVPDSKLWSADDGPLPDTPSVRQRNVQRFKGRPPMGATLIG